MRRLLRHLILCCLLGMALAASAQPLSAQVVLVSSESAPAYAETTRSLLDALQRSGLSAGAVDVLSPDELTRRADAGRLGPARIFVGLGVRATQSLLAVDVNAPVLSTLIPRRSFEQLLRASGRKASDQLSAIYLDQSLRRQIALVRLALPQAQQIGVLLGPDSVAKLPELRTQAQGAALLVRPAEVVSDQALFPALREVLDGSDVFLALADPVVFNSTSIQNILLSSFRARVPMMAFSTAYVRAGASLALYSSPTQVGKQAGLVVMAALRSGHLPEQPIEPDDFLVDVNPNVTRALGLTLDGVELRQALRRLERLP
ncbi:MAG: hypothetical protein COZ10_02340 [Comamonadaceae bacterium CG_4_10_14_3_um_filter_60_75]|nr:MAG: hypothetical protein COW39_03050 [Comamonadaceae bacterium CG17_big_fil_post_rev_8_21_14_2_50_60_13]PIY26523.1 MAG: hypothetical protein COZ10_02340 [Comamonadaceae bacterium CG_4_10_14_3_um_filter_60_75]